jgi:hypothetical protein
MDFPPQRPPEIPLGSTQPGLPLPDLGQQVPDRSLLPQMNMGDLTRGNGDEVRPDVTPPQERRPLGEPTEDTVRRSGASAVDGAVESPALASQAEAGEADQPGAEAGAPTSDLQPEAREVHQGPIKIVEIGAGANPIFSCPQAPDVKHLYKHGGTYVGLDADAGRLAQGEDNTRLYRTVHTDPEVTLDARFEQAGIAPGKALPESVPPGSADRVVIRDVFTLPQIARDPDMCRSIADAAMNFVNRDTGQVVVVGTMTSEVFPRERVDHLMANAGFERVGSDDPALYYTTPSTADVGEHDYAERYRPIQPGQGADARAPEEAAPGDTNEVGEAGHEVSQTAERPFTLIEIGSGNAPGLLATDAPDVRKLLTEGGRYAAIDSDPERLAHGAANVGDILNARESIYDQSCGAVETSYHAATVGVGTELPEGIEPASADRVLLSNLLSRHMPTDTRTAIIQTTADLLVSGGEAVVADTLMPGTVSPAHLRAAMASAGLEYVGSDDVTQYTAGETIPGTYVHRFRKLEAQANLPEAGDGQAEGTTEQHIAAADEAYKVAVDALRQAGRYLGDGHSLVGTVELTNKHGITLPAEFKLTDYHASSSAGFEYDESGHGADRVQQARLLETGDTIVSVQTTYADGTHGPSYAFMKPDRLRPDSTMGWFLHGSDTEEPPLSLPDAWPPDKPIVKRGVGVDPDQHSIVTDPGRDVQLTQILDALRRYSR